MANIICMKWGTKYGPEYVNRLANMVRRNMTIPHRFVCMTDDATGLDPRIDARPLPDFDDPGGPERGWRKISTFRRPLFDLVGPTLFLDLDIVIVDSIDCLFDHPGEFLIIKDGLGDDYPTDMPLFKDVLSDHDIWATLAFIKSTWPEEIRAKQPRPRPSPPAN